MGKEIVAAYRDLNKNLDKLTAIFQSIVLGKKLGSAPTIKPHQQKYILDLVNSIDNFIEEKRYCCNDLQCDCLSQKILVKATLYKHEILQVAAIRSKAKDIIKAQEFGGLLSVRRCTMTQDEQLHFFLYILTNLIRRIG
jgi:hypothetical protein